MLNDTAVLASYLFQQSYTYPYDLESSIPGVTVQVVSATLSAINNSITVISTLTVMNVSILNGSSLHCADNAGASSATINITTVLLGKIAVKIISMTRAAIFVD